MRRAVFVFHKSLTEPIPRLHGLPQVRAMSARRAFEVISFEPRRRSSDDEREYVRVKRWLEEAGVDHRAVPLYRTRALDLAAGALAIMVGVLTRGVRIVHCRSYIPAMMALPVTRVTPAKLLFDTRGLFVDEYIFDGAFAEGDRRCNLARRVERALLLRSDAVVVVSERMREHLLGRADLEGRLSADRVHLIPNRIDLDRFADAAARRERTRSERMWNGQTVVAYVASSSRWHGLDEAMSVFSKLLESRPGLRLMAATYPSTEPAEEAAKRAGVPRERLDLLTARPDDIPDLLLGCDLALMFEARHLVREVCAPVKFSEYLAAGLPIVANDGIGDVSGWISESDLGIIIDPEDPTSASEQVLGLLESEEYRSGAMSSRCRGFAEREMDMRRTLEEYDAVYRILDAS